MSRSRLKNASVHCRAFLAPAVSLSQPLSERKRRQHGTKAKQACTFSARPSEQESIVRIIFSFHHLAASAGRVETAVLQKTGVTGRCSGWRTEFSFCCEVREPRGSEVEVMRFAWLLGAVVVTCGILARAWFACGDPCMRGMMLSESVRPARARTNRFLLYFAHGGPFPCSVMAEMPEVAVRKALSLRLKNWDVMVMTEERCAGRWAFFGTRQEKCFGRKLLVHSMSPCTEKPCGYFSRYRIGEWNQIRNYDAAIYLDGDVLVLKDPTPLVDGDKLADEMIYAKHDRFSHDNEWFRTIPYTKAELRNFEKKQIMNFNSGTLLFRVNDKMLTHLNNVLLEHEKMKKLGPWFDQSYANRYFNLLEISNTTWLDKAIDLFPDGKTKSDATILHFFLFKMRAMKMYLRQFAPPYECDTARRSG